MRNSLQCGPFALAVVFGAVAGALSSYASAQLIAYEGFDYDLGGAERLALMGLNGGAGFTDGPAGEVGWFTAGTDQQSWVVADGFDYADPRGNQLVTNGGRVIGSGVSGSIQPRRQLDTVVGLSDGETVWMSFIGQRLQPHPTLDENVIRATGVQLHDSFLTPNERLAIGKGTTGPGGGVPEVRYNWGMLHSAAVANQIDSNVPITDQAFLLVRIDYFGNEDDPIENIPDNAYLWVNPVLDEEPQLDSADATFIGGEDTATLLTFDRVAFFIGNTTGAGPFGEFTWDELRIGRTYDDVTPFTPGGGGPDGDYNGDGVVDAADYTHWRDTDGTVEQFTTWKDNFGAGVGSASGLAAAAVPEPTGIVLAVVVLSLVAVWGRRRK